MPYHVLDASKDMPPLERTCSECNAKMKATGKLFHDRHGWFVVFHCPEQDQIVPVQAPEYAALVRDLTQNIDPKTLPEK